MKLFQLQARSPEVAVGTTDVGSLILIKLSITELAVLVASQFLKAFLSWIYYGQI